MNTNKALGWLLAVSLGALASSIIGCGGVVSVGGGDGSGGESGSGDGGSGDGGSGEGGDDPGGCDPGCPAPEAVAMTYAQLEAAQDPGGSGSSSSVGGGPDPSTQFLMFGGGTQYPTCSSPNGSGQCGGWSASIFIAPQLFQVGVIPFADPGVDISVSESFDDGNGQCSGGGGGGFEDGQLEILEITDSSVRFAVSGVSLFLSNDPNGERVASRCQ
jgi:hypothetical protein